MSIFIDRSNHYYVEVRKALLRTSPRVVFARKRPDSLKSVTEDIADRVLYHFHHSVGKYGGDPAAINLLQEFVMSAKGANLVVNLATNVVLGNFPFPKDAAEFAAKNDGSSVLDEAGFNALDVQQRCTLARPMLNETEAAKTADGEGFAKQAWKVAARFKNAKAEKAAKEPKEKKEAAPRKKGVKTLISELFTLGEGPATLHLTVEEIMAKVSGTKASVTTAISDLRSTVYCGKGGVVKLQRIGGKYALEGGEAAKAALETDAKVQAEATAAKEAKKAEDAAAKKAKEEAAASEKATKAA